VQTRKIAAKPNRVAARKRAQTVENFALGFAAAIGFVAVLAYPYAQHYFF